LKPKDRDFIQTIDDHLFCVVGYLHPPDRTTAYLKYIPSSEGKWGRGTHHYTRTLRYYSVSQVENTYEYLKSNHPEYLYWCEVRNITVSAVPKSFIKRYFEPRARLSEIRLIGSSDVLEEKLLELTDLVSEEVGLGCIGVTGSILLDIHNPEFSDIDLTVYGIEASLKLREALTNRRLNQVKPPSRKETEKWVNDRAARFPLSPEELRKASTRRWNYGYYKGTYFSIHPTRTDDEIVESYGDNTYHREGEVSGTARVENDIESIYLPSRYQVSDVEADHRGDITEVVSFEGMYGGLFKMDERIEFKGILERVTGKNPHRRVIIGGAGYPSGYIKWV
jgi:predicted nucleotidyltransferase